MIAVPRLNGGYLAEATFAGGGSRIETIRSRGADRRPARGVRHPGRDHAYALGPFDRVLRSFPVGDTPPVARRRVDVRGVRRLPDPIARHGAVPHRPRAGRGRALRLGPRLPGEAAGGLPPLLRALLRPRLRSPGRESHRGARDRPGSPASRIQHAPLRRRRDRRERRVHHPGPGGAPGVGLPVHRLHPGERPATGIAPGACARAARPARGDPPEQRARRGHLRGHARPPGRAPACGAALRGAGRRGEDLPQLLPGGDRPDGDGGGLRAARPGVHHHPDGRGGSRPEASVRHRGERDRARPPRTGVHDRGRGRQAGLERTHLLPPAPGGPPRACLRLLQVPEHVRGRRGAGSSRCASSAR